MPDANPLPEKGDATVEKVELRGYGTEKSQEIGHADEDQIVGSEKEIEEAMPAGWTIMRPLKKRIANASSKKDRKKSNAELAITETNDTGDRAGGIGGVVDLENLDEVNSGDELLEQDEERRLRRRRDIGQNAETEVDEVVVDPGQYKVYKRRWFGLVQLVLLNIIVSWDVSFSLDPYSSKDNE